ncbi:kinase-like protein [Lentinula lateritia]|uniref:Kinase-like protein n=1 Tax=Lentinula lateritia TaxID=40482 RepID=A0ABQ8V5N5_9AGAR|nr:kinase-like protein [Lentinula lateritia]
MNRPHFPILFVFGDRYIPCQLDRVEDVVEYRPGGFHPVNIGDEFADGRYKILHKLGFGGSSTVWLARDQRFIGMRRYGKLVVIKALRANISSVNYPDLVVARSLQQSQPSNSLRIIDDHFVVDGPNGSHEFLVSALAGPSVRAMLDFPERRRLRADLARKVAAQAACALERIHCAGFVHGDFTTSNLLFQLSDHATEWSDREVYEYFGAPVTDTVRTCNGEPVGPHAPSQLIEAIDHSMFMETHLLQEDIMAIDFGQAYAILDPPKDYRPNAMLSYMSPEAFFELRAGPEADVWALGCAIFEIRAGFPLFDYFFPSSTEILTQIVTTLGRLPNPWWDAFKNQAQFDEDDLVVSSIRDQLCSLGTSDEILTSNERTIFEVSEMRMDGKEVDLLVDLLGKMMRYRPEDRIEIREVVNHAWFKFSW